MSTSLVRMTATRRLRLGDNWYVEQGEPFRFPAGAAATLTDSGGAFAIDRPDSKPAMLLTLR